MVAQQHATFTRRQAAQAGHRRALVARRIDRGIWVPVNQQVLRLAGSPQTERQRLMSTVLSGGPDAVSTGESALALRAIRGARILPGHVITTRRPPRWAMPGVEETYRLPAHHRTVVDGIPTATVARALFDLGSRVRIGRLQRATDAALAAKATTVDAMDAVLTDLAEHGRHGSSSFRDVIAERRWLYRPPTTTLESAFLELVAGAGLPEPGRQIDLGGTLAWIGCVDFVWRRERVVVETDGGAYHESLTDRQDDERRDRALEHAGWIVLRFSYLDVTVRPTSVRRTLSRALAIAAA